MKETLTDLLLKGYAFVEDFLDKLLMPDEGAKELAELQRNPRVAVMSILGYDPLRQIADKAIEHLNEDGGIIDPRIKG